MMMTTDTRKRKRKYAAENAVLEEGNAILRDGMNAMIQSLSGAASEYDESTAKREKDVASLTAQLLGLDNLWPESKKSGKPVLF